MATSKEIREFRFLIGFEEVKKECTHDECRFFAFKVAAQTGNAVIVYCYNECLLKWDNLGTALPNGIYVDAFGGANAINKDGNGYDYYLFVIAEMLMHIQR